MTGIKTSAAVIESLEKAATRELSSSDLHAQRISFAMGALSSKRTMTREQVERIVDRQEKGSSAA